MPWPLEKEGVLEFVEGIDLVIVVEEKRSLIESQIKEILFDNKIHLMVIGKKDEKGEPLFLSSGALDTNQIAVVIGDRILNIKNNTKFEKRLLKIKSRLDPLKLNKNILKRRPYFCSGCPHNRSTIVPDGSIAMAGIGCHYMAQWMDRETTGYTHMGAEGANWIGQAPFSNRKHIFQNIGDGTYFHSGIMAIRAAVSAKINITYKILFNDAVAMTGGQGFDGPLTVKTLSEQVLAEGVKIVNIVSDDPNLILKKYEFPIGVSVYDRKELDSVQRKMREVEGVSVLIYVQVCAAEKRRRIKRGIINDSKRRIFINDEVCEGCGDCGLKSNCVSILPFETEFGRKRFIDQSSCNKDFSCVDGLCPSFVSVIGGTIKTSKSFFKVSDNWLKLPEPKTIDIVGTYNIVLSGVGGTGILTIAALLGMAAHIEKKGVGIIDMIGLAQKGGAVISHLRIGNNPNDIFSPRIASQGADLFLGFDLLVAGSDNALSLIKPHHTKIIVNSYELFTGDFTKNSDLIFPSFDIKKKFSNLAGENQTEFIDATQIASSIVGDSIVTNIFLLGYAFQKGYIPLKSISIEKSIEINGVAVEENKLAFLWGRRSAFDFDKVNNLLSSNQNDSFRSNNFFDLDQIIQNRSDILKSYQDKKYAERYLKLVERVSNIEKIKVPGSQELTKAVSQNYFKLLAYKDEYEVSRLYSNGDFLKKINKFFDGDFKIVFHLAPPLFSRRDLKTGEPIKTNYGKWLLSIMRLLSKLKFLRGTIFDPFGKTTERIMERQLIKDYENTVEKLLKNLFKKNHKVAIDIAKIPEQIRGFDVVKLRSVKSAKVLEKELLVEFNKTSRVL
tara:strand:- start:1356 stop:3869 length:2514 start_codon:yes stop_codon:yes gene_type:complete